MPSYSTWLSPRRMLMPSSVSALAWSLVVYFVSLFVVSITAHRRTNTSSYPQFPRFAAVPSQLSSEHGLANSHTQIPSLLLHCGKWSA